MIKSGVWDGTRLEQIKEYPTDLSLGGASLMRQVKGNSSFRFAVRG